VSSKNCDGGSVLAVLHGQHEFFVILMDICSWLEFLVGLDMNEVDEKGEGKKNSFVTEYPLRNFAWKPKNMASSTSYNSKLTT